MNLYAHYAVLLPILIGLTIWLRAGSVLRLLTLLCLLAGLNDLATVLYGNYVMGNQMPFLHVWNWVEASLLFLIYRELFGRRPWMWWLYAAYAMCGLVLLRWDAGWLEYPQVHTNLNCLLFVGVALSWFLAQLLGEPKPGLLRAPGFWIASGHFLYFAGAFITFTMVRYFLADDPEGIMKAWTLHDALLALLYVLYAVAMLVGIRTPAGTPKAIHKV